MRVRVCQRAADPHRQRVHAPGLLLACVVLAMSRFTRCCEKAFTTVGKPGASDSTEQVTPIASRDLASSLACALSVTTTEVGRCWGIRSSSGFSICVPSNGQT